jgi:hypothetical protein
MRAELAVGYCKYMNLREEAGSLLPRYHMDTQTVSIYSILNPSGESSGSCGYYCKNPFHMRAELLAVGYCKYMNEGGSLLPAA